MTVGYLKTMPRQHPYSWRQTKWLYKKNGFTKKWTSISIWTEFMMKNFKLCASLCSLPVFAFPKIERRFQNIYTYIYFIVSQNKFIYVYVLASSKRSLLLRLSQLELLYSKSWDSTWLHINTSPLFTYLQRLGFGLKTC